MSMSIFPKHIFCWLLSVVTAWSAAAGMPEGVERYYEPLDRLASNAVLRSRNKEAPTGAVVKFPFSVNDYSARMARLVGCTWNPQTSVHLERLTGSYAEKMYDALGVYAELDAGVSALFKQYRVNANYQLLAPMLSGMNGHYASAGGKRGIWQLDIVTAVRYGLTVSDTRDDRDDPMLAARAAAAYLKDLQAQFRTTETVLWAYIGSPAEVRRAFTRAGTTDPQQAAVFLPEYMQQAMPVFSAWVFIWNYTEKDDLPVFLPAVYQPYENAITADKTHLGQIAEMLDISLASLKELNPALKKWVAGPKETVHLPQGYASRFLLVAPMVARYKDTLYFRPEPVVKPQPGGTVSYTSASFNTTVKKYHKVKPGETLSQIAQKYHVPVSSLKKWNNMSSSGVRAGQKIVVQVTVQNAVSDKEDRTVRENVKIEGGPAPGDPREGAEEDSTPPLPAEEKKAEPGPVFTSAPKPKTAAWSYYTVRSGDTLSSLGRKYGVPYTKIKEWNGLRSDNLSVGQKLKIKK